MSNRPLNGGRWPILVLISVPIFIGALDLTVVSAVLPQVIYDLEIPVQTRLDDAAWLVSGYLLVYSVAMTFMGHLSDLYGRRRVYLIALGVFAIGSYLVAVADTWPTQIAMRGYYSFFSGRPDASRVTLLLLIVARMIQAFGGGAMVPVGMALVGDLYSPAERAKPLGFIAAIDTAGWAVGHYYGGLVTYHLDWRTIFWLNLPICALAFVLVVLLLRKPTREQAVKTDWVGALLIALGLLTLNLGLGTSSDTGGLGHLEGGVEFPTYTLPVLLSSLLLFILFFWRQARTDAPLIPLSLFRSQNFTAASIANLLVGFGLFVAIATVPLFINTLVAETLEQGALESGIVLLALTLPMALSAIPGGWLTERFGYRLPALLGLVIAMLGFGLMSQWEVDTRYATMVPHLGITGMGFGLTMAPIAAAVVNAAPALYRGTASAMVIIFRLVGMTVGVSSITTYGLHRADVLSTRWLQNVTDYAEMVRISMEVTIEVINEAFLISGIVCILALLPVLRLTRIQFERSF